MKCMQRELLSILPPKIRNQITTEHLKELQEIRLRIGYPVILILGKTVKRLSVSVSADDLNFCVNTASRYSPWKASTVRDGYLTAPGGHRIGLCGEILGEGIRNLSSLNIRVARDFPGIAGRIPLDGSVLIIGPPGSGKTTLLRDLIRRISREQAVSIAVVDQRGEIFPRIDGQPCFEPGEMTDIISVQDKSEGINIVLRAMGPVWIALDEITAESDCLGMVQAGWCGVRLIATAHAGSLADLHRRPVYRPLIETKLFHTAVILRPDKSWYTERMWV